MAAEGRRKRRAAERRGRLAEWLAILMLLARGYVPLGRRVRTPAGEIDLIARRGRLLVAVEVKARADAGALDIVSSAQRRRISRALEWWLARNPRFADKDIRFDLVLVAPGRWPHHVPHALDPN